MNKALLLGTGIILGGLALASISQSEEDNEVMGSGGGFSEITPYSTAFPVQEADPEPMVIYNVDLEAPQFPETKKSISNPSSSGGSSGGGYILPSISKSSSVYKSPTTQEKQTQSINYAKDVYSKPQDPIQSAKDYYSGKYNYTPVPSDFYGTKKEDKDKNQEAIEKAKKYYGGY